MKQEDLIDKYVEAHADCRWLDAGELRDLLNSFANELLAEKDLGWHSVEESLPPVDEEVIVLTDEINETLLPDASFVCVAHIVDPDLTVDVDGISYRPVSYNGWNVPGVKFWMPMPKLEEEK